MLIHCCLTYRFHSTIAATSGHLFVERETLESVDACARVDVSCSKRAHANTTRKEIPVYPLMYTFNLIRWLNISRTTIGYFLFVLFMIGVFLFSCGCFVRDCNWLGLNSPRFKSIGCCKGLLQFDFVFEIPNGFFRVWWLLLAPSRLRR